MFRIAVCMKSVLLDAQPQAENTVERTEKNSGPNPFDLLALECAVSLRGESDARVSVLCMGAKGPGEALLREAAKLGPDQLYLVCDPLFAGSDTYATAKILCRALDRTGPFDMVLCGERAVDGETGQVPGELSAMLGTPYVTSVEELSANSSGHISGLCRTDGGYSHFQARCPVVLGISCGMRGVGHPMIPSLAQLKKARDIPIQVLDHACLGLLPEEVGQKGSLTRVIRSSRPDWGRNCRLLDGPAEGVSLLLRLVGSPQNGIG